MTLLFGHDETVADWVAKQKFGRPFTPPFTAIGVLDAEGTLTGGIVFTGFNGDGIELSLAGPGVVRRGAWKAVLQYVFEQLKCSRLQAHTSASNKIVRTQLPRLGFVFEGPARRYYGRDSGLTFSLTVDDLPAFRRKWKI